MTAVCLSFFVFGRVLTRLYCNSNENDAVSMDNIFTHCYIRIKSCHHRFRHDGWIRFDLAEIVIALPTVPNLRKTNEAICLAVILVLVQFYRHRHPLLAKLASAVLHLDVVSSL